jgi:hypothetical protein
VLDRKIILEEMMFSIKLQKIGIFALFIFLLTNFAYAAEPEFHANFIRIFNTETDNISLHKVEMSRSGNVVMGYGRDSNNVPVLYRMNSDGNNFIQFILPQYVIQHLHGISDITINSDGTIAYFYSGLRIYKVVDNNVTEIFNSENHPDIHGFINLHTTTSGGDVYFLLSEDYRYGSVWKMDQNGQSIEKVIDPTDLINGGKDGAGLSKYAISDDASTIAFILRGYWDQPNVFVEKTTLYVKTGSSSFNQLTVDADTINVLWLGISGNGNKILFHKKNAEGNFCYYTINADASNEVQLTQIDIPDIFDTDYNGTNIFISDSRTSGSLMKTDGSGEFDILPFGHWAARISMSYDNKVCVNTQHANIAGIYIGHLDIRNIGQANPVIDSVFFEPPVFPKNNPGADFRLKAQVSSPGGLGEIDYVKTEILINGDNMANGYSSAQVWFPRQPNDDGIFGDQTAGDGIYTTFGEPTSLFDSSHIYNDEVYVRVYTHNENAFAVQDVKFIIQDVTSVEEDIAKIQQFSLSQNYPNPFNPTTKIKYSIPSNAETGYIPSSQNIVLKVYDILGNEVAVLVNEPKAPGSYEVEFNAGALPSGIYFYQLRAGEKIESKKMLLIK